VPSQIAENSGYFSYPILETSYPLYLLAYGIVVPFVMSMIVNLLFINRKLSREPLLLLRKTRNPSKISQVNLGNLRFMSRFRLKLFVREMKLNFVIAIGIFLSLLLVMLALCIYTALTNIVTETERDVSF
jgi:putative ABC transport system permease protein